MPAEYVVPPKTEYAKSGDVHVAYQLLGDGPVNLVFVPGFVSHVEHFWEDPSLARFLRRLASFSRLVFFDKRARGCRIVSRRLRFRRSKSGWMTSAP